MLPLATKPSWFNSVPARLLPEDLDPGLRRGDDSGVGRHIRAPRFFIRHTGAGQYPEAPVPEALPPLSCNGV